MGHSILSEDVFEKMAGMQRHISNLEAKSRSNRRVVVSVGTSLDGNTDFTDIQNAIDYVKNKGSGTVFIKDGIHTLSADLILKSNVKLLGESRNSTILDFDGGDFLVKSTQNNFFIENLSIINSTDANGALYLASISAIRMTGVTIAGSTRGLNLTGCSDVLLLDIAIEDCGSDGLKLISTVDYAMIHFSRFTGNGGWGVRINNANCNNNTITNCAFSGNSAGAINDSGTDTITDNNQT